MRNKMLSILLAMLVLTGCSGNNNGQMSATAVTQAVTEPMPELGNLITAPVEKHEPVTLPSTETMPPPTTKPTAPAEIMITKHPSSEIVSAGGRTWFIANAENESQITWEFFSPDGTMYSLQQAASAHPGLILEILPEDTLGLRQIPSSFNGWSARARYDGPGGTATTERAMITVRDPYSDLIEIYRSVHRSGTGNIEYRISELVNPHDFLGYALKDLDGNGVEELILASDGNNEFPYVIYDVYTLKNGAPEIMIQSRARARYFLLQDGRFLMEGSSGAMHSSWITYDFSSDVTPAIQEQIWTSDQPHDMADFAPYYYYSLPYGPEEPIVYDEAARTIEQWERAVTLPALIPIN